MKSSALKQHNKESHLKLVKNSIGKQHSLKNSIERIYINTLIPGFNYRDKAGNVITPKNCALL